MVYIYIYIFDCLLNWALLNFFSSQNPDFFYHNFHKILSRTTIFNIDSSKNITWAANQHNFWCDTEYWSNDENSALQ